MEDIDHSIEDVAESVGVGEEFTATSEEKTVPSLVTGETIMEVDEDNANDMVVVQASKDSDTYQVQLPDGNIISTTGKEIDRLKNIDWTEYPIDEDWTKNPWEPDDPLPNRPPLPNQPEDPIGVVRSQQPQTRTRLNYECPNCGGRFSSWHEEGTKVTEESTYYCPFCMKQRGEFGPNENTDEENEDKGSATVESELRRMIRDIVEEMSDRQGMQQQETL